MKVSNIDVNMKTGDVKTTGEFSFSGNLNDPTYLVRMGLTQLKAMEKKRKKSNQPDTTGLGLDIFSYEWILSNDKCIEYRDWKDSKIEAGIRGLTSHFFIKEKYPGVLEKL